MRHIKFILILVFVVSSIFTKAQEVTVKSAKISIDNRSNSQSVLKIISPNELISETDDLIEMIVQRLEIQGIVQDKEGVQEMSLNGTILDVGPTGYFKTNINIVEGSNQLVFSIMDLEQKVETKQFLIEGNEVVEAGIKNRYALIIGNNNYETSPLTNAGNDAASMAEVLTQLGWEVNLQLDIGKRAMIDNLKDFGDKVDASVNSAALFFYAGHGLQHNGKNYLVPVDAEIDRAYDIEHECVPADRILTMLEYLKNEMNIIILDACRNNPYARSFRSMDRGLAVPDNAPTGSVIAFSTAPGKVASDGDGQNGLYTQELLKAMQVPGLTISQVFNTVRRNVIQMSNEKQVPWENSSLLGDFYFVK